MHYWELFQISTIFPELQADDKDALLREMTDGLVQEKHLTKKEATKLFDLLKKREQGGSTGIGFGVAIPHVKVPGLTRIVASLGIHRQGLDFRSIDGEPVHVVFLVARPQEDSEEHLRFLQWISKLARHADFRRFATRAKDSEELLSLLKEMSSI